MGFLIFAYRKLFLTRKMNDLNFQSMLLSQKKQEITSQISLMQEAISNSKSMVSMMANVSLNSVQQNVMSEFFQQKDDKSFDMNKKTKEYEKTDPNTLQQVMAQKMSFAQQSVMAANAMTGSVFDAVDKGKLAMLNAEDSHIDMQIKNIESQSMQLKPELESVEKAEGDAAKSEAPKFGLA